MHCSAKKEHLDFSPLQEEQRQNGVHQKIETHKILYCFSFPFHSMRLLLATIHIIPCQPLSSLLSLHQVDFMIFFSSRIIVASNLAILYVK